MSKKIGWILQIDERSGANLKKYRAVLNFKRNLRTGPQLLQGSGGSLQISQD
jgi:hypothetical protein